MVTVISDKEELTTPVHSGVPTGSNDYERPFQYIKDYQEVDFHRSTSCKPLPDDLFGTADDTNAKSSIQGTFYVQVDDFEPINQSSYSDNNYTRTDEVNDNSSWLLTLTDGEITIKGITNDSIPRLSYNIRPGCKLSLSGVIPIKDGLLQLTHENTRFQYGSSTYPRPKSAYRGRRGGSSRPSYEGRRGGGNNSNSRYDNDHNESNFFKRAPPKNTLMDFMTSLNIANDTKQTVEDENQKVKDRSQTKRRNNEHDYKTNNDVHTMNVPTIDNTAPYYQLNEEHIDQITFQQDGINDQLDPEDDSSHSSFRERRNPLPPRLQRAQEERTRRNTNRYYDETTSLTSGEMNGNYRHSATNDHSLSSTSSYSRQGDQISYISNGSSSGQQYPATLNSYMHHQNILATVNGSTSVPLAYFHTNSAGLTYGLPGVPNPSFHSQQSSMGPSYPNDHLTYCYGTSYAPPSSVPAPVNNGLNGDSKTYHHSFIDDSGSKTTNESQPDEHNNSENKSQASSIEQKHISPSFSSSSNDGINTSQHEQQENKRRDPTTNSRPRWKVGDVCLARWNEDREFYVATVVQIQPPCCIVIFQDYNNYDRVHFSDLRVLPSDQQYYQFVPPIAVQSSDLNALAASVYFPPTANYYSTPLEGCLMMPEAPPFPFNSAGTLYMCQPNYASDFRSNRSSSYQQPNRRLENGNSKINDTTNDSSSSLSKDSNNTSTADSTSIDDHQKEQEQEQQDDDTLLTIEEIRPCSIADAPLTLVTKDDERELSTSTESLTSSKYAEQQSTNGDDKQENNSIPNLN